MQEAIRHRVRHHRERALQARAKASNALKSEDREMYLGLAEAWENLADAWAKESSQASLLDS